VPVSLDQPAYEAAEPLDVPDDSADPARVLLQDQLDRPLEAALEALQPAQRATVLLCDVEGATYEEAARVEECPIGTIRSRLHRAHHALRDFLARFDAGDRPEALLPASRIHSRRAFLMSTVAAAGAALPQIDVEARAAEPVRVLVWCGDRESSSPAALAAAAVVEGLEGVVGVRVAAGSVADAEQGLSEAVLQRTEVLVWIGGAEADVAGDRVSLLARRVRHEGMGLMVLHSGADAPPLRELLGTGGARAAVAVESTSSLHLRVTAPRHPIAAGVERFHVAHAARQEGELDVPRPDVMVFDGQHEGDEQRTPQGMVWRVGRGRIFYFRPRGAGQPMFQQPDVRQVVRNAVRWCASRTAPADGER
jgi:trehalose utilization protein